LGIVTIAEIGDRMDGPARIDDRLEPALRHLGSGPRPSMAEETARCVRVEEAALRTYGHD
jgi:hypothetical protein